MEKANFRKANFEKVDFEQIESQPFAFQPACQPNTIGTVDNSSKAAL